MSTGKPLGDLHGFLIDTAVTAARAALRQITEPAERARYLDATAERLKFDAEGERKLAERKARSK